MHAKDTEQQNSRIIKTGNGAWGMGLGAWGVGHEARESEESHKKYIELVECAPP